MRRKFRRDVYLRARLFDESSFQHKAKLNLYWLAWLLDHYAPPGRMVLDPMAGSGSVLLAALKQRPVMCGDIESHWCRIAAVNAARIRAEQLFVSPVLVVRWDAARLPVVSGSIPCIVTSPPYFDMFSNWNRSSGHGLDGRHVGPTGNCYGFSDRQMGNIHVYDDYLCAMQGVYQECWRVLRPGGILVLVVGDRVKRKRRVPIVHDTAALVQANGFKLLTRHERSVIPSQFRNIHYKNNGGDYPVIKTETALAFQKEVLPARQRVFRYVIVQAPRPDSSPGRQLFEKQLAWAWAERGLIFVLLASGELILLDRAGVVPNVVWSGDHGKARRRKDWAFGVARDLVTQFGLVAGDEVELHVNLSYARYLEQRLSSFGARVTIPTSGCNFGQKLAWYTERLKGGGQ